MARKKSTTPTAHVNLTLPQSLADFMRELKWELHKETPDLYREAVLAFAVDNGYVIPEEGTKAQD